jgi:hypothetical protein
MKDELTWQIALVIATLGLGLATAVSAYFAARAARFTANAVELESEPVLTVEPVVDDTANTITITDSITQFGLLFSAYDPQRRYVASTNAVRIRNVGRSPAFGIELFCTMIFADEPEIHKVLDLAALGAGEFREVVFSNKRQKDMMISFAPVAHVDRSRIPDTFGNGRRDQTTPSIKWLLRRNRKVSATFNIARDKRDARVYSDGPILVPSDFTPHERSRNALLPIIQERLTHYFQKDRWRLT